MKLINDKDLSVRDLHHLAIVVNTFTGANYDRFSVNEVTLKDARKYAKRALKHPKLQTSKSTERLKINLQ